MRKQKLVLILVMFIVAGNLFAQGGWTSQSSNVSIELFDVKFININTGFVVGDSGKVLRTTNSGVNWITQTIGTNKSFTSISFIDANTGWIAGLDTIVYKTTDGGQSWIGLPNNYRLIYPDITFTDAQTGYLYARAATSTLLKTTNGGVNWQTVSIPIQSIYAVRFINSQTGWMGGVVNSPAPNPRFYTTTNGGTTWTLVGNYDVRKICFINGQTGFTGSTSEIHKTTNTGANWSSTSIALPMLNFDFINDQIGWGLGSSIYRTNNSGVNWELEYTSSVYLNSIDFVNQSIGWAVGRNGTILYTTTGGVSVTQISTNIAEQYSLNQNYPNPFNPNTVILYQLSVAGFTSLKVFDLLGKEVATLVNEKQNAGSYAVDFNSAEFSLPSGIYFYTLSAGEFKETKKMVLVK